MRLDKQSLKLYAITNRQWLKENETLEDAVEQAILGHATMIQLREKDCTDQEFIEIASKVKKVTEAHNIPLIINDNLKVAKAIDASGVHLGQDDLDVVKAREILGPDKIIGLSIHNYDEYLKAKDFDIDYFGIGAVFNTSTKLDATDVSIKTLKQITENSKIYSVAIGGITKDNVKLLRGSHINGIAVVSAIFKGDHIQSKTKELYEKVSEIIDD